MMREYAFRVKAPDSPLVRFTRDQPGHRIVIQLLRGNADEVPERAIVTFLGNDEPTRAFLANEFAKRYGTYVPLREDVNDVSVEVSTHTLPRIHTKTPVELTYELLGPDAILLPLMVEQGWIHVRVVSGNQEAGASFLNALRIMRNHLQPDDFHVYEPRPYRPELHLDDPIEDITPRQMEVLSQAYRLGYWAEPRRCNLDDVAESFGVSKAAVHKSLSAAQRKIMASFFARRLHEEENVATVRRKK